MARRDKNRAGRGEGTFEVARKRVQRIFRQEGRQSLRDTSHKTLERNALLSDALSRLERLRALRSHLPAYVAPGRDARREAARMEPYVAPIGLDLSEADRGRTSRLSLRDEAVREHVKDVRDTISRDQRTCKERPRDGHKNRGGGRGSRPFIPWCDRRS